MHNAKCYVLDNAVVMCGYAELPLLVETAFAMTYSNVG